MTRFAVTVDAPPEGLTMRHVLSISIAAAALLAATAAVRAGDPPPAAAPASPADELFKRLVSGRATDRTKADADLAAADRDTLAVVAKRLRDEFAPKPARIATSTLGVNLEARWITVRAERLCPLLGADPCASDPAVVAVSLDRLLSLIEHSKDVQQVTASKITVLDRQNATVEILDRSSRRPGGRVTGVVLGLRPAIADGGKRVRLDTTAETRRVADAAPGAMPDVVGASWRSDLSIPSSGDVVVVFPAAFQSEPKDAVDRRLVLVLHAEVIDLGPEAIGAAIADFEPSFQQSELGVPTR